MPLGRSSARHGNGGSARSSDERRRRGGEQRGRQFEVQRRAGMETGAQGNSQMCRRAAAARCDGASMVVPARAHEANRPIPDETKQRWTVRRGSDEARRRDGLLVKKTKCVDLS
ncbi:hypothetical protein Scep_010104 [Stephania cephalantha]|uniref:Uncharacterized protein n=1 Tax=Stephania cephalantha TaxID=152367 RepID=A0AAP0PD21_9MAGN